MLEICSSIEFNLRIISSRSKVTISELYRAVVDLKVHVVEVWMWFEFFHILLYKNNVTAERCLRQTGGEARDPEVIKDSRTDQVVI